MKSRSLLSAGVFPLLLMGTSIRAQIAAGPKGGVNFNTLRAQYSAPPGSSTVAPDVKASGVGFHLGFFVNTGPEASAAMRIELLYSDRSTADVYDFTTVGSSGTKRYQGHVEYTMRYMEVPVLLTVRTSKELSFHGGAAAALLISASSVDEGTETWTESGTTYSNAYIYKGTDKDVSAVSIDLVLGWNFELIPGLCFGMRYLFDLNDLDKTEYVTAKGSVFQVGMEYTIGGAKKE